MKEDNCRFYILFVLLILFFQDSVDQFFVDRKEMSCHWSYTECADDGSDSYGAAKDKADDHKGQIYDDSYDAEFLFGFITDDNSHQIVWTGSGIRFDDDEAVARLSGKAVTLTVKLFDSDIYAVRFE